MKRTVLVAMLISFLLPSIGSLAYAGEIQVKELSQSEIQDIAAQEIDSAMDMESIKGGEADPLLIVFAVIGVLVLIGAFVAAGA
jgi:hypothetical protein